MENLSQNKHLRTAFFFAGRPHKQNPFVFSIPSQKARSFYRAHKKKYNLELSEKEFVSLFWKRSHDYSRTKHYTKQAKWIGPRPEAPQEISLQDFPNLSEDKQQIFQLLIHYYNENAQDNSWDRGYYFSALYYVALELSSSNKDYLATLQDMFNKHEIWNTNTKSFWNSSSVSILLNNSELRKILLQNHVNGFDISNAFPTLLSQSLDTKNIPNAYIRSYSQNRSSIIEELLLIDPNSFSPLLAKRFKEFPNAIQNKEKFYKEQLLATLFGRKWGKDDPWFLRELEKEIDNIKENHFNGDNTALSYSLYEILGKIQSLAKVFYAEDLIATVCDCFYVRQGSKKTKEEFADYVFDLLGYSIRFDEKL